MEAHGGRPSLLLNPPFHALRNWAIIQAVSKNILKFTATGLVAGAVLGWLLSLVSGKLFRHTRCGNARTFRRGSSWNCLSK